MQGISCFVNFKENLNKNVPYYSLLMRQINGLEQDVSSPNLWIGEDAALCVSSSCDIVSSVCEGYQFTIAFRGQLDCKDPLKNELSAFGYRFLTEKDAELALCCYIHFGKKCAEKLMGSFSFIIYDAMRRQVFALSDPNGSMPLFHAKTDGGYIISSSAKGILAHPDTPKRLSGNNLLELLSAKNRISLNIFEDVYILPPKNFLKISRSNVKTVEYSAVCKQDTEPYCSKDVGVILSNTDSDRALLESLCKLQEKDCRRISVYAEKCPDDFKQFPIRTHSLPIDDGTVFYGLESCVSACGFPFLSSCGYLLPIVLRKAKGCDEALFFTAPDRFYPQKDYVSTLIKNDAFYPSIEKNISDFKGDASVFPSYPQLISDTYDVTVKTPFTDSGIYYKEEKPSLSVKTALRHILLDVISKEHSPITAFFKRSSLLRLCEGSFTFQPEQSDCELMAYLIKLNIWFEMYRPRIV